ncbi:MAG: ribokinase [Chloroflexi bacterium HGW-Chloroflexi-5]|jgi:ribokinase|nr:MAG: ribokinase [Chloroflexi bacterium HGW-Chloroflexi-5]
MNIVVVGSLNMDLVVRLPKIPKPGETLLGGVFNTYPGGKGANQAVAASRLGGHVSMIGCVGDDSFGRELVENLTKEGVDTSHVFVQPIVSSGVALIQVDDQAQNSIAVASGANFRLSSEYVEKAMQAIEKIDVVVMQLETPLETIYTAARVANQRGAKVILNPAPAQVLENDLLQLVDYLIPNEYEIATMTGFQIQNITDVNQAAQQLFSKGVKNLIVTLGNKGSVIFEVNTNNSVDIPAWKVQAVDTTAAGDCFIGAFAVGLSKEKSVKDAAAFASAAAAISVTRVGAQPSLPTCDEVNQFMIERNL